MKRYILLTLLLMAGTLMTRAADKDTDQVFDAKLLKVQTLSSYSGKALKASVDPRFVIHLRLEEDVVGLGKKGETVAVAIHSPARDLAVDTNEAIGTKLRLHLSFSAETKSYFLGRRPDAEIK